MIYSTLNLQNIKTLLVEDDPIWATFIESLLFDAGCRDVLVCKTLADVKIYYDRVVSEIVMPDVIIADIMINHESIFESINQELFKNIPILFITGFISDENFESVSNFENKAYLSKPFDKFTFISTLELILGKNAGLTNKSDENFVIVFDKNQQKRKIKQSEIVFIEAEGNYTFINTVGAHRWARKKSLKYYLNELTSEFIQINKSCVVNTTFIQKIEWGDKKIKIADQYFNIGRAYNANVNDLLNMEFKSKFI